MRKEMVRVRNLIPILLAMTIGPFVHAFPREMIIQSIKGPWELVVSMAGQEDTGVTFPIEVADEDAQQSIGKTFPVMGTPLQVKVLEYCPDLGWETIVREDSKGGPVATITIAGKGNEQEVLLLANVPERRAVTASIGGLAIRRFHDASTVQRLLEKMASQKASGLLTVWTDPNAQPLEFVVKPGDSFEVLGTSYKAEVLEYLSHYSIDQKTKEVKNYSDQPTNPALKVRLSDGQDTYEQWCWSNFGISPHAKSKFPIRVEFSDFDLSPSRNRYFIATTGGTEWWLYYQSPDDVRIEKGQLNHPYPFNDKEYTFTLDSILAHGTLSRKWVNNSDQLNRPALVVEVESDKGIEKAVLNINQPTHVDTPYGTLALLYRQKVKPGQPETP